MYETVIPMGKMLNAFLAIHGRCKFIIFLRGQTPSLSAPTLILSLMEHFQGNAKNTVKHSIKSTFSISIQLNCNWLPGNPQLPPYIYIHIDIQLYPIISLLLYPLNCAKSLFCWLCPILMSCIPPSLLPENTRPAMAVSARVAVRVFGRVDSQKRPLRC